MKKLRVVASILGVLLLTLFVLDVKMQWRVIPHFDFFWNIISGLILGLVLAVLPFLAGAASGQMRYRAQWWIGLALIVLVLFFQYLLAYGGLSVPWLRFLRLQDGRALMGEGVVLGFTLGNALRAKR